MLKFVKTYLLIHACIFKALSPAFNFILFFNNQLFSLFFQIILFFNLFFSRIRIQSHLIILRLRIICYNKFLVILSIILEMLFIYAVYVSNFKMLCLQRFSMIFYDSRFISIVLLLRISYFWSVSLVSINNHLI